MSRSSVFRDLSIIFLLAPRSYFTAVLPSPKLSSSDEEEKESRPSRFFRLIEQQNNHKKVTINFQFTPLLVFCRSSTFLLRFFDLFPKKKQKRSRKKLSQKNKCVQQKSIQCCLCQLNSTVCARQVGRWQMDSKTAWCLCCYLTA